MVIRRPLIHVVVRPSIAPHFLVFQVVVLPLLPRLVFQVMVLQVMVLPWLVFQVLQVMVLPLVLSR